MLPRRYPPESRQGRQGAREQADARPLGLSAWNPAQYGPPASQHLRRAGPGRGRFAAGGAPPPAWGGWTTDERLRFLNRLPRKLPKARLDALQSAFGLNGATNMEVRFAWLDLAVGNRYDPAVPSLEHFLRQQGRGKFVRPLFKALAQDQQWGRPIAEAGLRRGAAALSPLGNPRFRPKLGNV